MEEVAYCLHCSEPVPSHRRLALANYCCEGCKFIDGLLKASEAGASEWGLSPRALPGGELENLRTLEATRLFLSTNRRGTPSAKLMIEGFHCVGCQSALARLPEVLPELSRVEWNSLDAILTAEWRTATPDLGRLGELLARWGFRFRFLRSDESTESESQRRRKQDLIRLGVVGGLSGNIMIFAFAIYAGAEASWSHAFVLLMGILFLPVATYGAYPFYQSAYRALKSRELHLDFPLTFAFLSGTLYSYARLIQGNDDVYFDSLSGFLFLILISRFLLGWAQRRSAEEHPLEVFFDRSLFKYRRGGQEALAPVTELIPGDWVYVPERARVPIDGRVQQAAVEIDTAYLNGETQTRWVLPNGEIRAGSFVNRPGVWVKAERCGAETDLGRLVREVRRETHSAPVHPHLSSRVSQILTLIVLAVAGALVTSFHQSGLTDEGLRRAFALMILACPCAIAFGTPLALAQGLKLAFREGLLIRSAEVFEKLKNVKRIAFDKTGTLTTGHLRLSQRSPLLDDELKSLLLSLEAPATHPIAHALRRAFGPARHLPLENLIEVPGSGPAADYQGHRYEIQPVAEGDTSAGPAMELRRDGEAVLRLNFEDNPRPEATEVLNQFKHEGRELFILSGDATSRVTALARTLDLPTENARGSLKPEDKRTAISQLGIGLYVGDGTNDVSSLVEAPVSYAMPGSALEAQLGADVIGLRGGLEMLPKLFHLGQEVERTLRRNLGFALGYNLIAGTCAVMGWIGPMGAALLMPISSLLILFSSLWLTRRSA
ncbi:MAG: cation-translocating P-type ATPase [Bdellovibrionaceae bacterium]|nr:cation-translocating P-type ATPase [Pseudobdellovibrionaceae bacterium]